MTVCTLASDQWFWNLYFTNNNTIAKYVTAVGLFQRFFWAQSHTFIEQYDANATGKQKWQYQIQYNTCKLN